MRGFKIAAAGIGILIALIIGWAVVGFVLHAVEFIVIAALVVGAVAVAIKVASMSKQVTRKRADREVRRESEPEYGRSLPRTDVEPAPSYQAPSSRASSQDIDDELARLKREMGA